MENIKTVKIPMCEQHGGINSVTVELEWKCPTCGEERGEVKSVLSYDGSRQMACDGWENPCGHTDIYSEIRIEAVVNGLNTEELTYQIIVGQGVSRFKEVLFECYNNDDFVDQFNRLTGNELKKKTTGLEAMIDEATGYSGTPEKAWRDFFKFVDEYVFQPLIGSEVI